MHVLRPSPGEQPKQRAQDVGHGRVACDVVREIRGAGAHGSEVLDAADDPPEDVPLLVVLAEEMEEHVESLRLHKPRGVVRALAQVPDHCCGWGTF